MKKNNPKEHIRKEIDELDLKILDLLSKRKVLVSEIVKYKTRDQIIDNKRIEVIMERLKEESKKKQIPYEIVRGVWDSMIKSFIAFEQKIFDKKK